MQSAELIIPLTELVIKERADIEVFPGQSATELVRLASDQANVVRQFEAALALYAEKSRQKLEVLQTQLTNLQDRQSNLYLKIGAAQRNYTDVPWVDTPQGERIVLKLNQELGKDIGQVEAQKISRNQSELARFLNQWADLLEEIDGLTVLNISSLPSPSRGVVAEIDPLTQRILTQSEFDILNDELEALLEEYQKLAPITNKKNILTNLLKVWEIGKIDEELDKITIFDYEEEKTEEKKDFFGNVVIDASGNPVMETVMDSMGNPVMITVRVDPRDILLPANYELLADLFTSSIATSKLSDVVEVSRAQLTNNLTSTTVDLENIKDPLFMQAAAIVHLHAYLTARLMEIDIERGELVETVSLGYVKFASVVQQLRLEVMDRIGNEYAPVRQSGIGFSSPITTLRTKLAKLQLQIKEVQNFNPITKDSLHDIFYEYIAQSNTIKGQLEVLVDKFIQSSITAQLKWPEDVNSNLFVQGVYSRVINPDVGSKTFPIKPLSKKAADAKMTVASFKGLDKIRLLENGTITEVDLSTLTVDPPRGSCGGPSVSYREYQKFIAAYLFGADETVTPSPLPDPYYFPISPYRGILAKWGVGAGKTSGATKCMLDYFDNYDKRYQGGSTPPLYDFSNWVILWVPNETILKDAWQKDLESLFSPFGLTEIAGDQFDGATSRALDESIIHTTGRTWKPMSERDFTKFWFFESNGRRKYIMALSMEQTTPGKSFWVQAFTNKILENIIPNTSGGTLTNHIANIIDGFPNSFLSIDPESDWKKNSLIVQLKRFSPFQIIDEFHGLAKPLTNVTPEAKLSRENNWTKYYPDWCWSKILALSATPFDTNEQNLEFLVQSVQLLKYYPRECPPNKTYQQVFPSGIFLRDLFIVGPDNSRAVNELDFMNEFFTGWMSNVSLNFDTTIYPYYNTVVCTADNSKICITSSEAIKASSAPLDLQSLFVPKLAVDAPGGSTIQSTLRDVRDWRNVVPNLIYVSLTEPSIDFINSNWDSWTNWSNTSPILQGKFVDFTKNNVFNPIGGKTNLDKVLITDIQPDFTINKYDLTEDRLLLNQFFKGIPDLNKKLIPKAGDPPYEPEYIPEKLTEDQILELSIEDLIGFAGFYIKYDKTKIPKKQVLRSFQVNQPLAVGGLVGAKEKGEVCSLLLNGIQGKFIFIQTSASNSSLGYNNFWKDFWDGFDTTTFPVFQELPLSSSYVGSKVFTSTPNLQCDPDPWFEKNSKVEDLAKETLKSNGSLMNIDQAVEQFFINNSPAKRVIFLDAKNRTKPGAAASGPMILPAVALYGRQLWDVALEYWKKIFNHYKNYDGSFIKAVFLGPPSAEGVSFMDITHHVNLNTPQSITVKTQSEARGARQCSQMVLAWHKTQVTAEVTPGTTDVIKYNFVPDTGYVPEIVLITLIATIPDALKGKSKMKITPDLKMANYVFRDPNRDGDEFLRYLETLAVDYLLFGAYSGTRRPKGIAEPSQGEWNIAKELVLEALRTVTTPAKATETKLYVDYVSQFYQNPDGKAPSILDKEKKGKKLTDVYDSFLFGIAEQLITEAGKKPNILYDSFAKIVYMASNSLIISKNEDELTDIGVFRKAWRLFSRAADSKPIGQTTWLQGTYLPQVLQRKVEAAKSMTVEQIQVIERQAVWIKELSQKQVDFQKLRVKENYLANSLEKLIPESGYYEKLQAKPTPGLAPQNEWTKASILTNIEQGPDAYKTTYPI